MSASDEEARAAGGAAGATEALPSRKAPLRRELLAWRRALDPATVEEGSAAIADRIAGLPLVQAAATVALYQALRNEVAMLPLWRLLREAGKQVVFPRVHHGTRVMAFAPVDDPAELVVGSLGVHEPPPEREVSLGSVEVFVVPALGFDRAGRRLGRGGGYYDATLAAHPAAFRVGPCLEGALLEQVPAESHDEPVDVVVTPSRLLACATRRGG